MCPRPFEEFPIGPEQLSFDDETSGRGDRPSDREHDPGEAWDTRPETPSSLAEGSSSREDPSPFQMPWDGNQYAVVVAGEEASAAGAGGPAYGAALERDAAEALPIQVRKPLVRRVGRVTRELVETLILALLIFLAVRAAVQNFQVEGSSMIPNLHDGEFLLVNKLIYAEVDLDAIDRFIPFVDIGDGTRHLFRAPQRGDVVVFKFPRDPSRDFIKRIIGVPGDTVEVRDSTVFIDGQPLDEPYLTDKPNYVLPPITVPPGQYFVLGDNRPGSFDSHSWTSYEPTPDWPNPPFVPEENIIGQAWLSYWPSSDWGLVPNKSLNPSAP